MTVAPLIAMKGSAVKSFAAIGMELDRRAHTYVNDVKPEFRHIGICCRPEDDEPVPLEEALERRMGELNTARKIRDNQVRAMGFIVSSNDALPEPQAVEFLEYSIEWFANRYGRENLLAAEIHLDEGTPHAHIWQAPVIHDAETGYDRLCAKELFAPDKRRKLENGKWEITAQGTMSRLQEDFYEQVASKWGYERPLTHEQRAEGYRSLEAYKVHMGVTRELKAQVRTLENERHQATERLEEVRQATRCIESEIEDLQPAAQTVAESARTLSAARGLGEREEALEREVEGLRSRVSAAEQRVEGLRYEVEYKQGALAHLGKRLEQLRQRLKQAIERVPAIPITLSRATLAIAKGLGKPTYNPRDYQLRPQAHTIRRSGPTLGL